MPFDNLAYRVQRDQEIPVSDIDDAADFLDASGFPELATHVRHTSEELVEIQKEKNALVDGVFKVFLEIDWYHAGDVGLEGLKKMNEEKKHGK